MFLYTQLFKFGSEGTWRYAQDLRGTFVARDPAVAVAEHVENMVPLILFDSLYHELVFRAPAGGDDALCRDMYLLERVAVG